MSEKNTDGTWALPDASVSQVWSERDGLIARYNELYDIWYDENGHNSSTSKDVRHIVNSRPIAGHWLPWTPPTFPERMKTPLRRARVRRGVKELVACYMHDNDDCKWCGNFCDTGWVCRNDSEVTVLEWLDPEYEDEN